MEISRQRRRVAAKRAVQSYFDFRPCWRDRFPPEGGTSSCDDKCKVRTLTATEGECSAGSFRPSGEGGGEGQRRTGRKGLFDKPDTCVLFSPVLCSFRLFSRGTPPRELARTRVSSLSIPAREGEPNRACYFQTRSYDSGNYSRPRNTGIMRVDGFPLLPTCEPLYIEARVFNKRSLPRSALTPRFEIVDASWKIESARRPARKPTAGKFNKKKNDVGDRYVEDLQDRLIRRSFPRSASI